MEKNDVSSFSQSPLIGSLSNLQITRTYIKALTNSNLGRIGLFTLELFAIERSYSPLRAEIFPQRFIIEKMMSQLFLSKYEFNFHQTYR